MLMQHNLKVSMDSLMIENLEAFSATNSFSSIHPKLGCIYNEKNKTFLLILMQSVHLDFSDVYRDGKMC